MIRILFLCQNVAAEISITKSEQGHPKPIKGKKKMFCAN